MEGKAVVMLFVSIFGGVALGVFVAILNYALS